VAVWLYSVTLERPSASALPLPTIVAVGVMFLSAVWAVAFPARGIQDRIAKTWLVPK
jgi:hypothetical protein